MVGQRLSGAAGRGVWQDDTLSFVCFRYGGKIPTSQLLVTCFLDAIHCLTFRQSRVAMIGNGWTVVPRQVGTRILWPEKYLTLCKSELPAMISRHMPFMSSHTC